MSLGITTSPGSRQMPGIAAYVLTVIMSVASVGRGDYTGALEGHRAGAQFLKRNIPRDFLDEPVASPVTTPGKGDVPRLCVRTHQRLDIHRRCRRGRIHVELNLKRARVVEVGGNERPRV